MDLSRGRLCSTALAIALAWLGCRETSGGLVEVDPLVLHPQSSLSGQLATYGNRIGTPYHETSLKRVEVDSPWSTPHGGLLRMFSSLDLSVEGWFFAEQGDHIPGSGNSSQIPYAGVNQPVPSGAPIPSEIFYLGFIWSDVHTGYGWAKLQVAPSVPPSLGNPQGWRNPDLILLASAITFDVRGIVVGEYRVIPEPNAFAIMAVGATLLMQCKRRGLL